MNPIADLEALAAEMEEPQPDAVLGCEIGPWTIQLRAIIEALKKRDEAVRFCIEYSKRPDTHDKDKLTVIHARLREALGE